MRMFTKEEIKELFAENNKAIAENNKAIAETRKAIAETNKAIAETNRGIAELRESQKKTDAQIAKTDAQIAKTDAQLAETAKQLAETDASLKRLGKRYGGFSNNVGSATEEYFYNALKKKRVLNGIRFDSVQRNWGKKGDKQNDEFDIVMLMPIRRIPPQRDALPKESFGLALERHPPGMAGLFLSLK